MIYPFLILLLLMKPILTKPIFLNLNQLNLQSRMEQVHEIIKVIMRINLILNLDHIVLILRYFQLVNQLRCLEIFLIILVIQPVKQKEILQAI